MDNDGRENVFPQLKLKLPTVTPSSLPAMETNRQRNSINDSNHAVRAVFALCLSVCLYRCNPRKMKKTDGQVRSGQVRSGRFKSAEGDVWAERAFRAPTSTF